MHTLPTLPYDYAALEPFFDAQTMQIHHTKHHQTYVDKLNAGLEAYPELAEHSVEALLSSFNTLPEALKPVVRNHGGGHHNHSFFWTQLTPGASPLKNATLMEEVTATFGSSDAFKTAFTTAATAHFGSGWAWLVRESSGSLTIVTTPNQDSPLLANQTPLIGLDVWEHAYYLKYQNRRPEYVAAFWSLLSR